MKKSAIFAGGSLALILVLAWLFALVFPTPHDRHAITVSAIVAYVVQLCSFAMTRAYATTNVMAAWGLGMLLRFFVLAAYALVGARLLGLPMTAALVSLAAFFFVSTLLEPVLLSS